MASSTNAGTAAGKGSQPPKITEAVQAWAKLERGISRATLERMPVVSGIEWFPELGEKSDCIKFGYKDGWKARSLKTKSFTQKQGTKATFWNLRAVLSGPMTKVYVTEGEMDALALVEAGVSPDQVLSLPSASVSEGDAGSVPYVIEALENGLSVAKEFVWCGDADAAGKQAREAVVSTWGKGKTRLVTWPEGAKDANDYLRSDGAVALLELVTDGTTPWPIDGLYRLSELKELPQLVTWELGFDGWKDRIRMAPKTLSVVTGHPGHGKTTLFGQIFFQIARNYELRVCVASFETRPKPHYRRLLRSLHSRRLEVWMNDAERAAADSWIEDHYLWISHPERRPDLGWLLDQAEAAVVRHGVNVLQIDPWNRLEASRGRNETETEYIGRCLRALYNFADTFNCHVQVLAHPSKRDSMRREEPPDLEDIAGSKHWDNMVDQGFVVHRPRMFDDQGNRETYAELHHKKARFDELGYPTKFGLDYDPDAGRYGICDLASKRRERESKSKGRED